MRITGQIAFECKQCYWRNVSFSLMGRFQLLTTKTQREHISVCVWVCANENACTLEENKKKTEAIMLFARLGQMALTVQRETKTKTQLTNPEELIMHTSIYDPQVYAVQVQLPPHIGWIAFNLNPNIIHSANNTNLYCISIQFIVHLTIGIIQTKTTTACMQTTWLEYHESYIKIQCKAAQNESLKEIKTLINLNSHFHVLLTFASLFYLQHIY